MKKPLSLAEGEYRFAALVWANEPLSSGQLVRLAAEALGDVYGAEKAVRTRHPA